MRRKSKSYCPWCLSSRAYEPVEQQYKVAVNATREFCEFMDSVGDSAMWKKKIHQKISRLYKEMKKENSKAAFRLRVSG